VTVAVGTFLTTRLRAPTEFIRVWEPSPGGREPSRCLTYFPTPGLLRNPHPGVICPKVRIWGLHMSDLDPRIANLASRYGIATEFWDWKGHYRQTPPETLIACLKAMDVPVSADDWVDTALIDVDERPWQQPLPPCIVVGQDEDRYVNVHVTAGSNAHVWVRLEDGSTFALDQVDNFEPDRLIGDRWIGRATFRLPTWAPPGYHTLYLESQDQSWETALIVTPAWVGTPKLDSGPGWGLMVQLYSLYGERSWGIGDFADLAELAVWARSHHGADFILINPVHAAEVTAPMAPSPYLPVTRQYINPIYIRPELIPEYAAAPADIRAEIELYRRQAREAADDAQVQRDAVWEAKKAALARLFHRPLPPARRAELEAYTAREGERLTRYALWCALTERHGQVSANWPAPFQDPASAEVRQFADRHQMDVDFYRWLQWIADDQIKRAQADATRAGMRVGIIADLAVGVNPDGEETWSTPALFAKGAAVGAPPDEYNQFGQNWSQPPWRPDRLEAASYRPWRNLVATVVAQSGGVRVDHIMGLFRLWWIPEGTAAADGAYVYYNHEALLGILALEASRAGAVLIGEDLGTVEPVVREFLERRGILGTSVLWFENGPDGQPKPPERWRELCLASVTTHDLPPTLGYLAHDHVTLRHQLGLLTEPLPDEVARDAAEQGSVRGALAERGLVAPDESDPNEVLPGLYRYLTQTPAKLKCVALTDVVGERRTQNQPGTTDEYPNWRLPLADATGERVSLERVFTLADASDVIEIMTERA